MDGLLRTYKLLLPNTITSTAEAKQRQKRHLQTQINMKLLITSHQINNKKNKSNQRVEIQPRLLQTWNQKCKTLKESRP